MHVLHSSGVQHRWYCISFIKNVCDMIYKTRSEIIGLGLLDCVGQPYHLPSDLIVTLLTELAQLENERFQPEEALNLFYSRTKAPQMNLVSWVCVCVCVFFRVCLCADVVVLALSRRPVPPSSGKTLFALADAPWMQVLKSSLPPQFSGETGTTSFRKKKKKSSWSFKRHGITLSAKSCPVRRWDFRGGESGLCKLLCALHFICRLFRFERVCVYFRTTSSTRPVCE